MEKTAAGFCEESVCGWIRQPSNTWSNIGFLLVTAFIFWDQSWRKQTWLGLFGWVSLVIGLASTFFHMSSSVLGANADYITMYSVTSLLTSLNIRRLLLWGFRALQVVFIGSLLAFASLYFAFPSAERWLYALLAPCCYLELILYFRDRKTVRYRLYVLGLTSMTVGFLLWWLDVSGRFCDPARHWISGHALWHLFTASALLFIYWHYTQFDRLFGRNS
ncbi:MAG: ceramidase domain-containing protein [Bdellovibrionales bacterium]